MDKHLISILAQVGAQEAEVRAQLVVALAKSEASLEASRSECVALRERVKVLEAEQSAQQ